MNTQEYINFIPIYIKRLEDDGSQNALENTALRTVFRILI